jgi:S1-C subfamily serine protease
MLFCLLVGAGAGVLTLHKIQFNSELPTFTEIKSLNNISSMLPSYTRETIHKSRLSTVKIVSLEPEYGMFSVATGTYFTIKDRFFVLTVNHGVPGECQYTKINVDGEFFRCKEFIELNIVADYAIIEIDKIEGRKPIHIFSSVPDGREWKDALAILNKVYFTGYPNNVGPLTMSGEIIGYAPGGLIYIRSYAWAGSSGSAVFTEQGEMIGYILAVDVGQSEYGEGILENILIVAPIYQIDWSAILHLGE